MKNQWYADGRDLVKWGVLIHLAKEYEVARILQVAYFRAHRITDDKHNPIPKIEAGGKAIHFPVCVWNHFRDIHHIKHLAGPAGIDIEIMDNPFNQKDRAAYTEAIINATRSKPKRRTLVFLDPDTGIAEERSAKETHVKISEVEKIWSALAKSDWLVLYQHAIRKIDWAALKLKDFQRPIDTGIVKTFRASRGARDVAFFCVEKR